MENQVNNYKCPACTGPLRFDGASGKLVCDFCGSTYEVAEVEAMYADAQTQAVQNSEKQWDTSQLQEWGVEEGMRAYVCPSCGAELICDQNTAATSCPYCGNPTIVLGQFSGGLKPDCIIPFKLDQKAAKNALTNHYRGKKLLPNSFASGNKIQELKGVYVPFWLFDGAVDVNASFEAENRRTYTSGDYEITETEHYDVRRAGIVPFEKIPVDASSKTPDAHMDAIEPFDYSELQPFSSAYLPGFLADKYDVSAEECAARADERAINTAVDAMRSDVHGYDSVSMRGHQERLRRDNIHYGLLPVYLMGTMWEGKQYLFAMNGQTGKLVGDLPVDKGKYWKWFLGLSFGITLILGGLLFAVGFAQAEPLNTRLLKCGGVGLAIGLIVALIVCGIFKSQMKTAVRATSAREYVTPAGVNMYVREDRYTHTTRTQRKIENKS